MVVANIKSSRSKTDSAKQLMINLKEHEQSDIDDKSIVGTFMIELPTKKFDWSHPINDHITPMTIWLQN